MSRSISKLKFNPDKGGKAPDGDKGKRERGKESVTAGGV